MNRPSPLTASLAAVVRIRAVCRLLLAAAVSVVSCVTSFAEAKRPNVIVFLVDDMGWMDCGAYGSKYYETPNIDRFATRAMRFTNAYAQPLCSPTRASLLTGKYSARHGITSASGHQPPQPPGHKFLPDSVGPNQPMLTPESKNYMEPSEYTLAEALRDAGYRTAHIGKWHLGLTQPYWPEQQGFDVAFHCHPDPGPPGNYFSPYGVALDGKPGGKNKVGTITDGPPGEYIVDRLADEAVRFITENKDRPFFLNLWNYGVHGPWGHKEEYTKAFASKKDPRGVQGNPIMASMLRSVDECFGRILDALEKQGLADNTIIVFNSDNGGNAHSNVPDTAKTAKAEKTKSEFLADWRKWAGNQPPTINTPLRDGKGTLYEGGTRVPLMWAWAGHIKPGATSDAIVGHIDLYPTLLDMAGIARPAQQKMDGVSYARVLKSEGELERKAFFNYFPHGGSPGRAGGVWVRSGDWKLIRWFGVAPGDEARYELYNLRDDVSEAKNLAAAEPARVRDLDALIDNFLVETGATYPRPNPAYKPTTAKPGKPGAVAADLLEGWKARQCEAFVKDGALTMTGTGKAGAAFLGHAMGKTTGPVTVKFRVRSAAGGAGKVEWMGDAAAGADPKSVAFNVAAGDWQEVSVEVPAEGLLGTTRLYLPAGAKPLELDWVELRGKGTGAKPQRWEFNASK
jgi:arylsulfatase A-like enzyme